jgi:hypothetical protein
MNVTTWTALSLVALVGLSASANAADKTEVKPPDNAPEYQAPPRPTDGANMALTIEKLEKGFDPDRPLLIWAIGSSFTNGLGDGTALVEMIRARFPNMPKVVYKKMAGNSTSYHFPAGWARHLIVPDQPDVVLLYNFGKTEDLETIIQEVRRNTTADIIVPTLHWCAPHEKVWGQSDAPNSHQDPPAMRAMCAKYGVEFVENRLEMTEYMVANKLSIKDLLRDAVHEGPYAAKMTVMNIARHFNKPEKFAYDPRSRERRVWAQSEAVKKEGVWSLTEATMGASAKGSALTIAFTGKRIDLIGGRSNNGGSADLLVDGQPADQVPAFHCGYILPDPKNAQKPPNPPRDRCPHRLTLGSNLIPQKWTLTMTSDKGDYELVGSVTGSDGVGNALQKLPFTSNSGQITIEPEYWRDPQNNRTGDRFTFEVYRCAVGKVDFKNVFAPSAGRTAGLWGKNTGESANFRLTLAQNLANGPHTLKLISKGDGLVTVYAFDVFEPPLK